MIVESCGCAGIATGLVWIVLCAPLFAQSTTTTAPSDAFAVLPADPTVQHELGWLVFDDQFVASNPKTHQYVFDVPTVMPGPTRSIVFRRAQVAGVSPATLPAFDIEVEVSAGHGPLHPDAMSFRFPDNRGPDVHVVTRRQWVHFPAVPYRSAGEYPFTHRIPFDLPFQFVAGSVGVVELKTFDSTLDVQSLPDPSVAAFACSASIDIPAGSYGNGYLDPFGQPCGTAGNGGENRILISAWVGGGNHSRVFAIPQICCGGTHLFFAGLDDRQWNGLALPFDLSPLGSLGCMVLCSLDWQLPTLTEEPWGFASADLSVPSDPLLVGAVFFVQMVHLTHHTNPLDVTTSNAFRIRVLPHQRTSIAQADWVQDTPWGNPPVWAGNLQLGGPAMMLDSRR